jgi:hypothetical protein
VYISKYLPDIDNTTESDGSGSSNCTYAAGVERSTATGFSGSRCCRVEPASAGPPPVLSVGAGIETSAFSAFTCNHRYMYDAIERLQTQQIKALMNVLAVTYRQCPESGSHSRHSQLHTAHDSHQSD